MSMVVEGEEDESISYIKRDSRAKFCSVIGQTTSLPYVRKDIYKNDKIRGHGGCWRALSFEHSISLST